MSDINELRKFLLGKNLYDQCKAGVSNNKDLEDRLNWLKERGFLLRSDVNDFVYLCGLKTIDLQDEKWKKFIEKNNPKVEDKVQKILASLIKETKNFNLNLDSDLVDVKRSVDKKQIPNIDFSNPNFCDIIEYFSSIDRDLYNKFLSTLSKHEREDVNDCDKFEPSQQVIKRNMQTMDNKVWKSKSSYCTSLNTEYKSNCNAFENFEQINNVGDILNIHSNWKNNNRSIADMEHSIGLLDKCMEGRQVFTDNCIFPESDKRHNDVINILRQAKYNCQTVLDEAKEEKAKSPKTTVPISEVPIEDEISEIDEISEEFKDEVDAEVVPEVTEITEEKADINQIENQREILKRKAKKKSKKAKKQKVETIETIEKAIKGNIVSKKPSANDLYKCDKLNESVDRFDYLKCFSWRASTGKYMIQFIDGNYISIYVDKYFQGFETEAKAQDEFELLLDYLLSKKFENFISLLISEFKNKTFDKKLQVAEYIKKIWDPKVAKFFTLTDDEKVDKFFEYIERLLSKNPFANSEYYPSFDLHSLANYVSSLQELVFYKFDDFLLELMNFPHIDFFQKVKQDILAIKRLQADKLFDDVVKQNEYKSKLNVLRIELVTTDIKSYLVLTYKPTHPDSIYSCDYEYYIEDRYICNAVREVFWEHIVKYLYSPVAYLFLGFLKTTDTIDECALIVQTFYFISVLSDCKALTTFVPSVIDIKRMKFSLKKFEAKLIEKFKDEMNIHRSFRLDFTHDKDSLSNININNNLLQYLYNNQHCPINNKYNPQHWFYNDYYWLASIFLTFYLWLEKVLTPPFSIKNSDKTLENESEIDNSVQINYNLIERVKEHTPALKDININTRN